MCRPLRLDLLGNGSDKVLRPQSLSPESFGKEGVGAVSWVVR